jgi:hypothetical protein
MLAALWELDMTSESAQRTASDRGGGRRNRKSLLTAINSHDGDAGRGAREEKKHEEFLISTNPK